MEGHVEKRRSYNGSVLHALVDEILAATPAVDIHTHLFPASFGRLLLWGVDDLLTYHYLEAELFRVGDVRPDQYWALGKRERADLIWRTLFVDNTPLSEATRGVIAVITSLGLDWSTKSLDAFSEASNDGIVRMPGRRFPGASSRATPWRTCSMRRP